MEYVSTRGSAPALDFEGATLAGLAADGGLYVPREWPTFTPAEIAAMRGLPYAELAARVMQPFVGDSLTPDRLRAMCAQAYGRFAHVAVTPLTQLDERNWLLELFHGPTLAFKDVALQLLGLLFEEFLSRREERLTIVGATSGDTGSAAIDAVAGRERIDIFMLHPSGRVSDVQRRQMTTVKAPNVHNIAIDGSFDDAQAMVKRMFGDTAMTGRFRISAVNSINWARLMAQVVYYFAAALQLGGPERKVAFSVPTGNFGDVFAGHVAARMGLPIERLIVATNVNDILHRALSAGDYSAGTVTPTAAPSMDIQVSSNFERLLFDVGGRDGAALAEQMRGFEASKAMRLTNAQREGAAALFASARADAAEMSQAMRWAYESCDGEVIDPHTAIGLHAARQADLPADVPVVTLATAHPAKFRDAVERATGQRPALPTRVGDLFERDERYLELPGDYAAIAAYVAEHATPSPLMAELVRQPLIMAGEGWDDYGLVDSGYGRKLERYGPYRFIRPEGQALWSPRLADWQADGEFVPGSDEDGGGRWQFSREVPAQGWPLAWDEVHYTAQCTPFRHLGFFPDMAPVWDWMRAQLDPPPLGEGDRPQGGGGDFAMSRPPPSGADAPATSPRGGGLLPSTLNLFGYTGVGSLALSECGPVTHVDASKKSVAQARENAVLSGMADRPIRWLVDDAAKFAAREVRRGKRYDGIILDPPKFGRGPDGEVWRLEEGLPPLIADCRRLLHADSRFLFLTVYAVRMSSLALAGLLAEHFADLPGTIEHGDLAVREEGRGARLLPTAIFARWSNPG